MICITLARNAMATRFEFVLHGLNATGLRAAGEEALDEIQRIESAFSLFRPESEITQLNALAAKEPVRVTPETFRLLERAHALWQATEGAFDVTAGPLTRVWGFHSDHGTVPSVQDIDRARQIVGTSLLQLDPVEFTVRFQRPGMLVDLGAIGKGYAIERAAWVLKEAGVESALLHGGTSTVQAIGAPPEADEWRVAIGGPPNWYRRTSESITPETAASQTDRRRLIRLQPGHEPGDKVLWVISLKDQAVSVSAVWGKAFVANGRTYGHIIDPRTGYPAAKAVLAAVALPCATDTDALSTALLVFGLEGLGPLRRFDPKAGALVLTDAGDETEAHVIGANFRKLSQGESQLPR